LTGNYIACFSSFIQEVSSPSVTLPGLELRRYREEVIRKRKAEQDIEKQLALLEMQLRGESVPRDISPSQIERLEPEVQGMAAD